MADELHIPQHVLRFWETKFPQVKPLKRGGGRRYYRPDDISLLRRISDLLYIQGYTIKGVQRLLREGGGKLSDDIPPATEAERAAAAAERAEPGRAARCCRSRLRRCLTRRPGRAGSEEVARLRGLLPTALDELEALRRCCRSRVDGVAARRAGCYTARSRSVAQSGSASVWGTEGRGFESRRSDQTRPVPVAAGLVNRCSPVMLVNSRAGRRHRWPRTLPPVRHRASVLAYMEGSGRCMGSGEFDAGAAEVRRAHGDMRAFLAGLAARLEGALPTMVTVERERDGLFSRQTHVSCVTVILDSWVYRAALVHGQAKCHRAKAVRGVTLSSQDMTLPAWLEALNGELRGLGQQSAAAHDALHDFLMS